MFNIGDLRGKFIMDRNLGARDTKFDLTAKGALQYPFGRKDPVAGINKIASSVTTAFVGRTSILWDLESGVSAEPDGVPIALSVNNPMVRYVRSTTGMSWCSAVDSESIIWHDMDMDVSSNGKSIFDPSPYGWKVPAIGVVANFTNSNTVWGEEDGQYGRSFPADDPFAFFPAYGNMNASTASLGTNFCTSSMHRTSTPSSTIASYGFAFANSGVATSNPGGRAATRQVRCVQHFESAFGN